MADSDYIAAYSKLNAEQLLGKAQRPKEKVDQRENAIKSDAKKIECAFENNRMALITEPALVIGEHARKGAEHAPHIQKGEPAKDQQKTIGRNRINQPNGCRERGDGYHPIDSDRTRGMIIANPMR